MKTDYISTKEIIAKYGVSNVTVAKWIREAIEEKNELKFENVGKRTRLLNTPENWYKLDILGDQATTKRNQIFVEEVEPSPEFYKHFSEDEILEIIRDLEMRNMINVKFSYKGPGAKLWNNFYNKSSSIGYETSKWTKKALDSYLKILVEKIKNYDEVNIIDLGCGNGKPVLDFLTKLSKLVKLKRYIPVEISQGLLDITSENVKKELPDLELIPYNKDLEKDSLYQVFSNGLNTKKKVVNIALIIGGNLVNTYDAKSFLYNVQKVINKNDFLIINGIFSNPKNNLNFKYTSDKKSPFVNQELWIPKSLGIDVEHANYSVEYKTSDEQKIRYITLDKDYTINFRLKHKTYKVKLLKKSKLTLSFSFSTTINSYLNLFDKTNFTIEDTLSFNNNMHFIMSARSKSTRVKNPFLE